MFLDNVLGNLFSFDLPSYFQLYFHPSLFIKVWSPLDMMASPYLQEFR